MLTAMAGRLILCATPIGNLGDASPRLAEALAQADIVYAEDTRRTRKLASSLGVECELRSYFAGNEEARSQEMASHLAAGRQVALVTDAGTPAVADPGVSAVQAAITVGAVVTVIPGPSAVTTALAASGFGADRFVFEGFLPRKGKQRRRRLEDLGSEERTVVLFVAPKRALRDLSDLASALGADRSVVVARELTKLHEQVWRGTVTDAAREFAEPKGEITLVIAPGTPREPDWQAAIAEVRSRVTSGTSHRDAARDVAAERGLPRRRLYEASR
jgi:16S rRNA (cytidine1402-2'-O)-methyltransferase